MVLCILTHCLQVAMSVRFKVIIMNQARFYCELIPHPVFSLLPSGLPPRTIAWTVFLSYSVFDFILSLFFRFCAVC